MKKEKLPPLNDINRVYYWSGYPNSIEMTIYTALRGELHIETLKKAALHIINQTPVLQTKISDTFLFIKRKYAKDQINIDALFTIDIEDNADADLYNGHTNNSAIKFLNKQIDLKNDFPIAFHLSKINENNAIFYLKVHHTVCDGYGIYVIVSHIFQEYNNLCQHKNSIVLPLETKDFPYKTLKNLIKKNIEKIKHNATPRFKAATFRDQILLNNTIKFHYFLFTNDELQLIKRISSKTGYSINALFTTALARAYYLASIERNISFDILSFIQYVDMRKIFNLNLIYYNLVSTIYLSIEKDNFLETSRLLAAIHEKTQTALDHKYYLNSLLSATVINKILPSKILKLLIKKFSKQIVLNDSPITAYFSNMGRLDALIETPKNCELLFTGGIAAPPINCGIHWYSMSINNTILCTVSYLHPAIMDETINGLMSNFKKELLSILFEFSDK